MTERYNYNNENADTVPLTEEPGLHVAKLMRDEPDDSGHTSFEHDLAHPEKSFVQYECTPSETRLAYNMHMRVISNPDLFVGKGYNATVYDFKLGESTYCLKHIWEDVTVAIKGGNTSKLPARYQPLVEIGDYMNEISIKKAELTQKGFTLNRQNSPIEEAAISNEVSDYLYENGYGRMIPVIELVYQYRNEVEEVTEEGLPFYVKDGASILMMERVPGQSIQDLILDPGLDVEQIQKIDMEAFETKLINALRDMHSFGVLHQDITNRNIMIDFKTLSPVIIDFGTATSSEFNRTTDEGEEIEAAKRVCKWLRKYQVDAAGTRSALVEKLDN